MSCHLWVSGGFGTDCLGPCLGGVGGDAGLGASLDSVLVHCGASTIVWHRWDWEVISGGHESDVGAGLVVNPPLDPVVTDEGVASFDVSVLVGFLRAGVAVAGVFEGVGGVHGGFGHWLWFLGLVGCEGRQRLLDVGSWLVVTLDLALELLSQLSAPDSTPASP